MPDAQMTSAESRSEAQAADHGVVRSIPAMRSATVSEIFFSLRGTLPRPHWYLAMVASISVFTFGASLFAGSEEEVYPPSTRMAPSWLLLCWCLAFLCVVTLLCAKRLLDCHRPLWLALTIPPPGVLLILAFASKMHASWSMLAVMTGYFALVALPAVLACALYDADD